MLAPMAVRAPPALKTLACRRKATQRHPFFSIAPYVPNRLANLGQRAKIMRLRHQILLARLLRSFHRATGSTPHQYVLKQRLDRACALLLETSDQVSTIAQRCGFSRAAHFSAIFHLHRGRTPSAFRRGN